MVQKKSIFNNLFSGIVLFFTMFLSTVVTAQNQVVFYDTGLNLTNLQYSRSEPVLTPCGNGERITKYDIQGRKVSEVDWYNGKRCGKIKIYLNGVLQKEINAYYDIIIDYTYYENGAVKVKISEDRNTIIRNGQSVSKKWDNIFISLGGNKIVALTRKEFLDLAIMVMMPEELADIMQGINDAAGSSVAQGNKNLLVCGGEVKAMPSTDIKNGLSSASSATKAKALDDLNKSVGGCAEGLSNLISSNFGGLSGPSARSARAAAASSAINDLIAKCEAQKDDNSMIATDPEDEVWQQVRPNIGPSLPVLRAAAAEAASSSLATTVRVVLNSSPTIIFNAAKVSYISGPTTSAAVATGQVTTTIAGASTIAGVALLGALSVGVGIGTLINKATDSWSTQQIHDYFNAKEEAEKAAAQEQATPPPPPPTTPSTLPQNSGSTQGPSNKLVTPDKGDKCSRLKGIRDRCESSNWQTMECQDFARIFSMCGNSVDPREVLTSADGSFIGGSCAKISDTDAKKLKCDKMGMVALVPPGGQLACSINKNYYTDLLNYNPKSTWWTDPVRGQLNMYQRGSLSKMFSKGKYTVLEEVATSKLMEIVTTTKKQTLVVFLDPDCPSCKGFTKTLNSPEVQNEIANGVDVIIVDAGANENLQEKFALFAFPSYFIKKVNGEITPMVIGSSSVADVVAFMRIK